MTTSGYYSLPADLAADIDAYERGVARFLAGEMPPAVFKARRVPRGVYEQRRDGTYMVRVRVAGGAMTHGQVRELAAVSREFSNGILHVTTRQDVQFHDVSIRDTPAIMRRLMAVGLTSKGGGGNTVRNIAACPYAGVCPAERFDITPCAQAVTEWLIPLVGSYNLPRKYKIAFSGCGADCALAQVADLGFIAEVRDGKPGFRVLAGGGMGAQSRVADTLVDWAPAEEIIRIAETVRRLFDRHGDRANKHRARLRFVVERVGIVEFRRLYAEAFAQAAAEGVPAWKSAQSLVMRDGCEEAGRPSEVAWNGVRVVAQQQAGCVSVPLRLPLGFIPAGDLARIGELAARYSRESGVRATRGQHLMLRSVPCDDLPDLVAGLRGLETDVLTPTPLDRFVACAGAATCRLGICLARNAARACAGVLADSGIARETLDDMEFLVNGCTNSCGQQPVGAIGFFGAAQRTGERLVPSYGATIGGRCGVAGARFGAPAGKVPAAALPALARELALDFQAGRRQGESFLSYADRLGLPHFRALVAKHAGIPAFEGSPEYYRDLGAAEWFSLAGRGAGECGAGVFEVIQQDLEAARKAVQPFEILIPAVRALLITRGVDARDPDAVWREFERHFIDTGLVSGEFRALLDRARGYTQGWKTAFEGQEQAIGALRGRVELLYSTLDANLEFHPPEKESGKPATGGAAFPAGGKPDAKMEKATATQDLSGVPCPMNFVKAKLRLETMNPGDTLAIVLDDGDPIRNVPASFKAEGQEVGEIIGRPDGRWVVMVRKAR